MFGLFGKTESSTKNIVHTSNVLNFAMEQIMNCSSTVTTTQTFNIKGDYNIADNIRQVQYTNFSGACEQDEKSITKFQNEMVNQIKQAAEQKAPALLSSLGGGNSAKTYNRIKTEVENAFSAKNIANIAAEANMNQVLYIEGNNNIISNISQDQSLQFLSRAVQKKMLTMDVINAIENEAEQLSKSEQTNTISEVVDSVGNAISSIMSGWMLFIGFLILVGLGVVFAFKDQIWAIILLTTPIGIFVDE